MSSPYRALDIVCTVAPGNSNFVVVLDSTRGLNNTQADIATGAAGLVPGPYRNRWAGAAIRYTALSTTQNTTLLLQILTGAGGVAGDWETQGTAGSATVTAGTTATGEFKPLSADFRVLVQAGATGPATSVVRITMLNSEDFGN